MEIRIPYAPREPQLSIHNDVSRFKVAICHRRMGKTVAAVNELIKAALTCDRPNPRFAYLAPTYKQAKMIAWDYLKQFSNVVKGRVFNESELRVDFPNGARIQLFGADNPDSLRGVYLDGVILDEVAQMRPSVWTTIIRPALSDRKGWAWFIGTPQGKNMLYELAERAKQEDGWKLFIFKASETNLIDAKELESARKEMSPDEYEQEFECSWSAAIKGAYYADIIDRIEKNSQITNVPYDANLGVSTWWDLGMNDDTTIWFAQVAGREIRIIDCYDNSGEGLQHYAQVLNAKGYTYESHNAPHDIQVREIGTGKSRIETAKSLGINFKVVPNLSVYDGISAVRGILSRCYFDKTKCAQGLEALRHYKKEYDEKRGVFKTQPLHDWSSHYADAFRYFAVGFKDKITIPRQTIQANVAWNVY